MDVSSGNLFAFLGGSPPKQRPRKAQYDGISGSPLPPHRKRYELTEDHGRPISDPKWPGDRKGQKEAGEAGKKRQRASKRLLSFFSSLSFFLPGSLLYRLE